MKKLWKFWLKKKIIVKAIDQPDHVNRFLPCRYFLLWTSVVAKWDIKLKICEIIEEALRKVAEKGSLKKKVCNYKNLWVKKPKEIKQKTSIK